MTHNARSDFTAKALQAIGSFRGKPRLADCLGRLMLWLGQRSGTFALENGTAVEIDLSDRIQRLMWGSAYEPHVRRCLSLLLRPGDVFVDVGAHIGFFSLMAALRVGRTGRVFAFEADPEVFQKLQSNGSRFPWLTSYPKAVWQKTGQVPFSNPHQPGETGWGKVAIVRNEGNVVIVEATSLDDWHKTVESPPIRLLKIDAEGSEPFILGGAQQLINDCHPYIIAELNDVLLRGVGQSEDRVAMTLRRLGYTLFRMESSGISELSQANFMAPEILCVPTERLDEAGRLLRFCGS